MYLRYVELLDGGDSENWSHYSISKLFDDLDDFLQYHMHINLISIPKADPNHSVNQPLHVSEVCKIASGWY